MNMRRPSITAVLLSLAVLLLTRESEAACMNRFVARSDGNKRVITLLTGKLTFDEAKALTAAIEAGQSPPIEWINESGRGVSRQFGALKVVRPMPVGCDGKSSGVVLMVSFLSPNTPSKKLMLKIDANTTVTFDEQTD